ncbi:MAG: zinc ribbon domain-containing protein [Thermoguttaceae bacterium]|nr:zinc ribbon domain-containing protein [Thermoguttaceae bacterium]MBQ1864428.1 zinc ribbon domain-containing protein [Thermoguttaceae bacterium]MBQ2039169.1 zinc ribbon domain-containing protein [Thermoguttaceae bacterium]MBQ2554949.1 zinc ribbon domain-containing protein [Thermoguttaceae bacterium]MBQ3822749.1 zinc ribbon domain-containing protein [Thermoguttaceae bacterium]
MPVYEYKCEKCGSVFEELVRNPSDKPNCPDCHSDAVVKRMSAPATQHGGASDVPCGNDCGGEHAHSCGCGCCHHH